jgi:hypothetical protein
MRDGFRTIAAGWTLIDDFDELGRRVEALAAWVEANGGYRWLDLDERDTVDLMIRLQVAWAIRRGDFEPFISAQTHPDTILNLTEESEG